jgi:hypothetical protein
MVDVTEAAESSPESDWPPADLLIAMSRNSRGELICIACNAHIPEEAVPHERFWAYGLIRDPLGELCTTCAMRMALAGHAHRVRN